MLLTEDGALAHDLLSPRHHVPKTYAVLLDTPLTEEMQKGFDDVASGKVKPATEAFRIFAKSRIAVE